MDTLDENGWAHIHHAAFRGFVKSVERFVKASEDQLELETGDDLRSTPLLLAVMSGNLETVKCLVELDAQVWVTNSQNHGVVELCAFKEYIEVLEYFIELKSDKLPVWKNLLKFMSSESDEEAESAAKCIRQLTMRVDDEPNTNWQPAYDSGVVGVIIKVIRSDIGDGAKTQALHVLLNLICKQEVCSAFMDAGGMVALVRHLKGVANKVIQLSAESIKELAHHHKDYASSAVQAGAIPALVQVLQEIKDADVLVQAADALGNIGHSSETHQSQIGSSQNAIQCIINLFNDCRNKELLMALTNAVFKLSDGHRGNQNSFIDKGVAPHVIMLTGVNKDRDLQLNAVDAVHGLADGNQETQRRLLHEGAVTPLMALLKKSRQVVVQKKTAKALWGLAGDDMDEQRSMACSIGVQLLIEFLTSTSDDLHFIGSEGLGVLARGALSKQTAIAKANGIHPLVRLLRDENETIVLSVIRTMRYLCVGVGYIPHLQNQETVHTARGIRFLVTMMVHSKNELIQMEAAHALAAAALGNQENHDEIMASADFSYVRVIKMLYSKTPMVRLLAGSTLATFAYNNLANQKAIADQGGVRFKCFVPFLQSPDEYQRCVASFQVVVLARIIRDEEQAISSAAGIKLIAELLHKSKSNDILALAADCVARLTHTRAGIPAAFTAIGTVDALCTLLESTAEQVQGCAAIALGYLSYNHDAKRVLLNKCRMEPMLMKIMKHYTTNSKLSPEFIEGWKHYQQVGLPQIEKDQDRPMIVANRKNVPYTDKLVRPLTLASIDDSGSNQPSVTTSNNAANTTSATGEEDRIVTILAAEASPRGSQMDEEGKPFPGAGTGSGGGGSVTPAQRSDAGSVQSAAQLAGASPTHQHTPAAEN